MIATQVSDLYRRFSRRGPPPDPGALAGRVGPHGRDAGRFETCNPPGCQPALRPRIAQGLYPELAARFDLSTLTHLALLVLFLGASSCAVGPNYKRPSIDVPNEFRNAASAAQTNVLGELPWWDVFKDPELKGLIEKALTNNYDLRIAVTRVEQARAIAEQNRALYFPQVDYTAQAARSKNAFIGSPIPVANGGKTLNTFLVGGSASWDIDLWGRLHRLNESARAQYLASQDAQRAVAISVISQVAQAYFRLLALDEQLGIAKRSTNSFGESLRIFSQRLEHGVVSKLETSAATAALASAAATVPEIERQIVIAQNLIDVLLGQNPGTVSRQRSLAEEDLALTIPPGLPSDLLRRRPDILEAEHFLISANAQVGVAIANFFPQLSLTALFGQVSPELSGFTSGAANAWSITAGLSGPLFHGGQLRGEYHQAKSAREESRLRYHSTVIDAFQEVSNDLVSLQKLGQEQEQQRRAVEAYRVAVQVSMERYVAGRASYYEVLQEQQQLFPAEDSLVQIQLNQLISYIQLYQALGGGFGPQ
jgi:multidrug efflux system outer membrane protein